MASQADDTVSLEGLFESNTSPATTTKAAFDARAISPIRRIAANLSSRRIVRFASSATRENGFPSCQSAVWMNVIMSRAFWLMTVLWLPRNLRLQSSCASEIRKNHFAIAFQPLQGGNPPAQALR